MPKVTFAASTVNANMAYAVRPISKSTQTRYNYIDNFSVEQGRHEIKFGVDYRKFAPHFATYSYGNAAVYLNLPTLLANLMLEGEVYSARHSDIFVHNLGLYAQDTWRVAPRQVALELWHRVGESHCSGIANVVAGSIARGGR